MNTQDHFAVKIYSDRSHYERVNRAELSSFLRPFWKDMPFTEAKRLAMYGLGSDDFAIVSSLTEADFVVVPMSWNYYLKHKKVQLALELIEAARKESKKILLHTTGDHGITVPFDDVYVLRAGGYKTKRRPRELVQPVFFTDPLKEFFGSEAVITRRKGSKPIVGFCGQAEARLIKEVIKTGRVALQNLLKLVNLQDEDPQRLYPPTLLRSRVLARLRRNEDVTTNFIIRDKYRAGAANEAERRRTTVEFYRNILESDYTVCLRGGGNFSKRFYETLAMGRIPLFINTDCNLPFEEAIDWSRYCLMVESDDLGSLNRRVSAHFESLTDHSFGEMQQQGRRLWEEWLNFGGFHKHFAKKLMLCPN